MRAPWLLLALMVTTGLLLTGCSRRAEQELAEPVPVATPSLPSRTLHVFCYHGVEDSPSNTFFNRTEDFAAQMQVLADEGFHCINCTQWEQYLAGKRDLPDKPVLLTFDDGNISVYDTVHPILQRHGFTATLFTTNKTNTKFFKFIRIASKKIKNQLTREKNKNFFENTRLFYSTQRGRLPSDFAFKSKIKIINNNRNTKQNQHRDNYRKKKH